MTGVPIGAVLLGLVASPVFAVVSFVLGLAVVIFAWTICAKVVLRRLTKRGEL